VGLWPWRYVLLDTNELGLETLRALTFSSVQRYTRTGVQIQIGVHTLVRGFVASKPRPLGEGCYSFGTSWVILDSLLGAGLTYRFVEV
jgi:hypothetical protein